MPVQRPALRLFIPASAPAVTSQQNDFTQEISKNSVSVLIDKIKNMRRVDFREAHGAPNYADMQQSVFARLFQGYIVSNHKEKNVFIHAFRQGPLCEGPFCGDKFHISVRREQVPQAFQILSGLLFSEDSPIDKWKVTDIDRVRPESRVSIGAQFTLYIKADQKTSFYSADFLHSIKELVGNIESRLEMHNISAGEHPCSDVMSGGWKYVSYRNEFRSDREGSEMQSHRLRAEPFYRIMTEEA